MKTKLIFIIFIAGFTQSFAQDNAENTQAEQWKWQTSTQELEIKLGQETLTPPSSSNITEKEWWKAFGYEELNILEELALNGNHDIKIGESRVQESRARVKYARSFLYPSVSFNPTAMRQEFSANRPMPFDVDVPMQSVINNTFTLPVDVSYEIDITGKISNRTKASSYAWQSSQASQEARELSVASQVARNFALLITLDSEKKILERTLRTRQENLEIVEARYSAGLTNEIDYQRAKTELSSVAVQLKNIQLQRTDVELTLAMLCGQPASTFSIESTELKYLAPDVDGLLSSPASGLDHPGIKAAEYSVESYKNGVRSAKKDLYPSLYLDGSLGLLSGQSDNIFESESRNWLIGATLSVPLFEGGRRRAQLAVSEQQLQGAEYQLEQRKFLANQEVEKALSSLARINEQLAVQQEFVSAAQKAAELSQERYRKGLVTYLEVVDAERVVLEAERLLTQLLGQQLISTIDLIEATGGQKDQI